MNQPPEKIRILLADDHVLIRHGIKNILNQDQRFAVVGEVGNGEQLIAFLEACQVDMVILDISMPGIGGMEAVSRVKEGVPSVKILMLTMHRNKEYFYSAMAAGADGYLMKDDPDGELLFAIDKVASGKSYISPQLVADFADDALTMYRTAKKTPFHELTKRERQVLHLVVRGYTSKKMASELSLSQRTIDHHRANLLRKFNRKNSVDLVNYAVQHGFVTTEL